MGTSNSAKNSAVTTPARADQGAGFKRCCLTSGRYDGALRNHFFQTEKLNTAIPVRASGMAPFFCG